MSFFALERFWKAARQSKSFPSYFFLCLFLVFFQQQIFLLPFNSRHKTSSFARQTQSFGGVIKCTMRPEILNPHSNKKKLSIYCIVMKQKHMLLFRKSEILHFKVLSTTMPNIFLGIKLFLFVKIES